MQKIKIYKFIVLLSSIFLCGFSFQIKAQEKKDTTKIILPAYQGLVLELDVVPLVEKFISNGVSYGVQGNLQANFNRKLFPVIEIGYAQIDKTLKTQTNFSGKGIYEKIGIDINLLKQKPDAKIYNNYLLFGARLGMSQLNYSINNIYIEDNYWGNSERVNIPSTFTHKYWIEIVGGMRVEIYKRIVMGWSVRNKRLLGGINSGDITPWQIPGYGKTTTSNWGFSYVIGYRF